jgi:hypothetical protein
MKNLIYQLEHSLLEPSVRRSPSELDRLIADDFVEVGASGIVYNKKDIIDFLPLEDIISFEVTDFDVKELTAEICLATYKCNKSLRSSIWKFNGKNWQMIFHQGTRYE